ncbi:N-acetyl-gamma-glutamyl-phosphate reductase [Thiohalospira sp.]|uniref:N-acetyl-gamma-glutamyl-phosphate reductase n=1 Tax=Thiohalospira sp. TaxID=3080549 RepID=UPI003981656F
MIQAGIVGGSGYGGAELMRLLAPHPDVALRTVTSRGDAGTAVADTFPHLRGVVDREFEDPEQAPLAECDVVLFATPNGVAMEAAPALLDAGVRVIDLAADFRLSDPDLWHRWYGMEHACPERLAEAVYGLPELNREAIQSARLVANPGCHVTAVTLGLLPLVGAGVVQPDSLIADSKSGASGAGRRASVGTLLAEAGESLRAYGAAGHRHLPEIQQVLESVGGPLGITFVPHLVPMVRGIEATLYARLDKPETDVQALFEAAYAEEPFVDVLPAGSHPETRSVRGSNVCRLAALRPGDGDTVVVQSVIDNLVKGAAGQAVQNLNLLFGLPETRGLEGIGLMP